MRRHVAQQGECIASIAAAYGFSDPAAVWMCPGNDELRSRRADPHLLRPGDVVAIPESEALRFEGGTDQRHRFEVERPRVHLRLVLADGNSVPLADVEWTLDVDGRQHGGRTADDGLVEVAVRPTVPVAFLTVALDPDDPLLTERLEIQLGGLDPIDSVSGAQARLNNLGFDCGAVDDDEGERTAAAVAAFRSSAGIEEEGPIGPRTRAALQERHGC